MDIQAYHQRMDDISKRALKMRALLLDPFRKGDGKFLGGNKAENEKRDMLLESVAKGTYYEMSEHGKTIAGAHARALQNYERTHGGRLPSYDLLASADKAIENMLMLDKIHPGGIFENAEMSSTDGIMMRDKLVSLVLPVYLQMITAAMTTFIPGEFNQSEFFRIYREAGSDFGTIKKGSLIDYDYDGIYSVMDQRHLISKGDGTTTEFTFDSNLFLGQVYPFKVKRVRVWVDHELVAEDVNNVIAGAYTDANGVSVVVSGTIDYALGQAKVKFSSAPVKDVEIHIGFDVDIEKDAKLIPRVDHRMFSKVLYPHESAITGHATIQAIWALRREFGQDIENLTMQGLRNVLAADKDRKHLHDMFFHARAGFEWNCSRPDALTLKQHYESLNATLLDIDTHLMKATGTSGLVGIVAGSKAANIFRYLPDPYFVPSPGYRNIAQPHYVGRVFQQWDLYCNPNMGKQPGVDGAPEYDDMACLCYARGTEHGMTAYVAGDAVPAITFRHPTMGDLVNRATMWELAYRDMQPFDGQKYLARLDITMD